VPVAPPEGPNMITATKTSGSQPMINLAVFDFDETLYDWIGHFVPALQAMIESAAPSLDISADELRAQLKSVHEHYGNTEHPFALLETAATRAKFGHLPRGQQWEALASAFEAFDSVRARNLKLYDDVEPAFACLRRAGIPIVGYTAATSVNISKRIKMLGLESAFDRTYASAFTGMPHPDQDGPAGDDSPVVSLDEPKPSPQAIVRICADAGVVPEQALFVGDSVSNDILPAIEGGANAALIRRDQESTVEWLPALLEVSHRRSDPSACVGDRLEQVPVVHSLLALWQYFEFPGVRQA
ncbi:MAG: HAD family hydrolase, partial [Arachnia sp.]